MFAIEGGEVREDGAVDLKSLCAVDQSCVLSKKAVKPRTTASLNWGEGSCEW